MVTLGGFDPVDISGRTGTQHEMSNKDQILMKKLTNGTIDMRRSEARFGNNSIYRREDPSPNLTDSLDVARKLTEICKTNR